jgi:RHS repeat-associated protein
MTSLQYDQSGNQTGQNGNLSSVYDAEGRLCATVNGTGGYTQYIYDAEGNRIAKGSVPTLSCTPANMWTNIYVLGLNGQQLSELSSSGAWLHTNVFAGGSLLATYSGNDTYFALNDWLSTKRVEITPDGLTAIYASLPFGDDLVSSGNAIDATEHHFTGKEFDTESGLDYFGARYYSSGVGVWMSPDWSAKVEPIPYAKLDNPQSLDLYGYVLNNPLSQSDPDGHCCWDAAKAWVAEHPRTAQAVEGVAKVAVGVGLVATIAGGDVPGSIVGVGLVVSGTLSAVGSVVSGVTDVAGAATKTNVEAAQKGLEGVSSLPALVTSVATRDIEKGAKVGTVADAAQLVAKPTEALKNAATMADAAKTISSTVGLIKTTVTSGRSKTPSPQDQVGINFKVDGKKKVCTPMLNSTMTCQ